MDVSKHSFYGGADSQQNPHDYRTGGRGSSQPKLQLAYVVIPQPEPTYPVGMVGIQYPDGPVAPTLGVAWPGPNVALTPSGIPGPGAVMFHGLYEGPMPGQKVLIGYRDGVDNEPYVVAKYSYESAATPLALQPNHTLPISSKGFLPGDIALGHCTGSYVALRQALPFPGGIDLYCVTHLTATALAGMTFTATGAITQTASAGHSVMAGTTAALVAGTSVALTAGTGMTLTASTSIALVAPLVKLGSSGATEAFVLGTSTQVELAKDQAMLEELQSAISGWSPVAMDGGAALKAALGTFLGLPTPDYSPATVLSTKITGE